MLTFIEGAAERAGQLYYRLTRPLRRLAQWARWTLLPRSLETCIECGAPAQWNYVPAGPRVEPEQRRDKRGGLLPCCEYDFYRWGLAAQSVPGVIMPGHAGQLPVLSVREFADWPLAAKASVGLVAPAVLAAL